MLYIVIILIAGYSTGCNELFKLPFFFRHYTEHKEAHTTTGIANFIVMHYFGYDVKDNDDKKDNQLPFKNCHTQPDHKLIFVPVHEYATLFMICTKDITTTFYTPDFLIENRAGAHFRPPCC